LTSLESTFSHTKWCWISMCLVWKWNTRLFPSLIEDWLSQNSLLLLPLVNPIGLNNLLVAYVRFGAWKFHDVGKWNQLEGTFEDVLG
jgi:hypothetical protein